MNSTRLKQYKRDIDEMRSRRRRGQVKSAEEVDSDAGCASDRSNVKDWMRQEQEALFNERVRDQGFDPYETPAFKYSKEANQVKSIVAFFSL